MTVVYTHLTNAMPMHSNPLRRHVIHKHDLEGIALASTNRGTGVGAIDADDGLGVAVGRRLQVRHRESLLHHFGIHHGQAAQIQHPKYYYTCTVTQHRSCPPPCGHLGAAPCSLIAKASTRSAREEISLIEQQLN